METTPTPQRQPLTKAQARYFAALQAYILEHGWAPTQRELADSIASKSRNSVNRMLRVLSEKGWIRLGPGARCIAVIEDEDVLARMRRLERELEEARQLATGYRNCAVETGECHPEESILPWEDIDPEAGYIAIREAIRQSEAGTL